MPEAMFTQGMLCFDRNHREPDEEAAVMWFERAAAAGMDTAFLNLGVIYEDRDFKGRDVKMALSYYEQAHRRGIEAASFLMNELMLREANN